MSDTGGSVYVIDGEGMAAVRQIKLGALVDGRWIVQEGLKAGDTVIVSNLQKIRPGVPVQAMRSGGKPAAGKQPATPAKQSSAAGRGE